MPRLIRGVARTAAIAGTATAVSNRVSRRQGNRWASQDEQANEQQQGGYQQQQPAPAPPQAPDPLAQVKQLGDLHSQGVLTDEEFAAQKAKILGS